MKVRNDVVFLDSFPLSQPYSFILFFIFVNLRLCSVAVAVAMGILYI